MSEVSFDLSSYVRTYDAFSIGSPPPVGSLPYSVLQLGGEYNVWRVLDGVPTNITGHADGGPPWTSDEIVYPVLSPDQSKVIYRMPRISDGAETLFGVDALGGTPVEILPISGHRVMHPMWHPDSDQIVYSRGESFAFGGSIWTTDYSGSTPVNLYMPSPLGGSTGYYCFRPQYNHDGTKIAFILARNSGNDANEGLYVMDADGSNVAQIAAFTGGYRFAGAQFAWGRTSDVLVYENAADDVYVINADGTGSTLVSVGATASQSCRVSKYAFVDDDSAVIISSFMFHSSGGFLWRPYRLEADGSGATLLITTDHTTNGLRDGPYDSANFTGSFLSPFDDRIYFITQANMATPGTLASIALDGSDWRIEHELDDGGVGDLFYNGTGFEYV